MAGFRLTTLQKNLWWKPFCCINVVFSSQIKQIYGALFIFDLVSGFAGQVLRK